MKIEYDTKKAESNRRKHGVSFDEAEAVLFDPYVLTQEDVDADGEHRFISLGMGAKGQVLMVVWTPRDKNIRLISAWKANPPQRKRYEQQFRPDA